MYTYYGILLYVICFNGLTQKAKTFPVNTLGLGMHYVIISTN